MAGRTSCAPSSPEASHSSELGRPRIWARLRPKISSAARFASITIPAGSWTSTPQAMVSYRERKRFSDRARLA